LGVVYWMFVLITAQFFTFLIESRGSLRTDKRIPLRGCVSRKTEQLDMINNRAQRGLAQPGWGTLREVRSRHEWRRVEIEVKQLHGVHYLLWQLVFFSGLYDPRDIQI